MSRKDKQIQQLKDLGVFRTKDAIDLGVSQPTLSRLASDGTVTRLEHGFFVHRDGPIDPSNFDFALAYAKFGKKSYVGAISALFRHGLIEQVPNQVWIITAPAIKSSGKLYRCIRTKIDLDLGIEDHRFFRISGIDRTIIDALYFSTKLGPEIAIRAARKAIKSGLTSESKTYEMACKVGMAKSFEKYWEALVS